MDMERKLELDNAYRLGQLDYIRVHDDRHMEARFRMPFIARKIYHYSTLIRRALYEKYRKPDSQFQVRGTKPEVRERYHDWGWG